MSALFGGRSLKSTQKLDSSGRCGDEEDGAAPPEVLEAEALVAARAACDAAA